MAKVVRVTRKQADLARAEVNAFRAIGKVPDEAVVRIAAAAPAARRAAAPAGSAGAQAPPRR